MKRNESTIFVFIASIFIGILIALNIHFGSNDTSVILSSKQYQEAYLKKKNLYAEVSNLKDTYYQNKKKLNGYVSKQENDTITSDIQKEVTENLSLLGYIRVKGPGVVITLNDADAFDDSSDFPVNTIQGIIHNTDMLSVVNELKNLGAEGISINGERILINSEINCSGGFISINQRKTPTPFYISVIGDKDVIENYLTSSSESYMRILENRGISIDIESKDEIILPKYVSELEVKYLSENYK